MLTSNGGKDGCKEDYDSEEGCKTCSEENSSEETLQDRDKKDCGEKNDSEENHSEKTHSQKEIVGFFEPMISMARSGSRYFSLR
ncbi:hypothetical protein JW890_03020 [candidate division WOR-3 bacterium]|nr:hypothetical protein [candidate division WOR-3 bacterium]